MKILTNGSTRIVILIDQYAIKIPRCCTKPDSEFYGGLINFLQGWLANRIEYKWSRSSIFDFLCDVEFSLLFSLIIIMKKAEKISEEEFFNIEKFNFRYEHKLDSYGKINNKIVVVDYGN